MAHPLYNGKHTPAAPCPSYIQAKTFSPATKLVPPPLSPSIYRSIQRSRYILGISRPGNRASGGREGGERGGLLPGSLFDISAYTLDAKLGAEHQHKQEVLPQFLRPSGGWREWVGFLDRPMRWLLACDFCHLCQARNLSTERGFRALSRTVTIPSACRKDLVFLEPVLLPSVAGDLGLSATTRAKDLNRGHPVPQHRTWWGHRGATISWHFEVLYCYGAFKVPQVSYMRNIGLHHQSS